MEDIEKKSANLIMKASERHASDIHFVPRRNDALIQYRINQSLVDGETISLRVLERLISHFKFVAGMDIGERRKPQNGAMEFQHNGMTISLRLSTVPTIFHESLVIRLHPQTSFLTLEQLSLFASPVQKLHKLISKKSGLLLVTGPTGSGKTTTLYTILQTLKLSSGRQVITLEDPVEKKNDLFLQIEMNEKAGITFAEGLRAILRHDPDIIMVGEIRDEETARLAVRAALTGHLVISTLHTRNAAGAVIRLLEFGIPLLDLKETLEGVIAQRLVVRYCPLCHGRCHRFCTNLGKRKQVAIFEILMGQPLDYYLHNQQQDEKQTYSTLHSEVRKAIALGLICETEWKI